MYRLCKNVVVSDLNGEIVVSRRNDPRGNKLITFNQVGQLIIQRISEEMAIDAVVDELQNRTGVGENIIRSDIDNFLVQLVKADIIEVVQ